MHRYYFAHQLFRLQTLLPAGATCFTADRDPVENV